MAAQSSVPTVLGRISLAWPGKPWRRANSSRNLFREGGFLLGFEADFLANGLGQFVQRSFNPIEPLVDSRDQLFRFGLHFFVTAIDVGHFADKRRLIVNQ
jgi:hypothetical protein